jgi:predicted nucleic acid binding AN1-type Zn finger protein
MRCSAKNCKRKLPTLTPFECKCKRFLCRKHRTPPDHDCDFNWHEDWANQLQKKLVRCVPDKLHNNNELYR